ncbi:MAG: outer membrane homotrimeric porin [Solidesulfovibrio sp.]
MKRFIIGIFAVALLMTAATRAQAATEVRMTGDALIYGNFMANRNFTGWNRAYWSNNAGAVQGAGSRTEDRFEIWERFRLRTDFIANEAVKFRLGLKVEDTWGHGTFTAANPSTTSVAVYQAFLQFKWPGCDTQITAGLQPAALPQSSFFAGSIVFDENVAGLIITTPLIQDTLTLVLGYVRTIGTDQSYGKVGENNLYANEEGFLLALPITMEGFKATPWAMYGQGGRAGNYLYDGGWAEGLVSPGFLTYGKAGWKNNFITALWAGTTLEVTALDPLKFYADVIWGRHGMNEFKKNIRDGWFLDAAAEYTGFDMVTPQVFGFWSTGEDSSIRNGSERLPHFYPGSGNGGEHNGGSQSWNAGNSFLFDGGQELVKGSNMGVNPVGSWGIGASFKNISFMEKLTHLLTIAYAHGNNSAQAIRYSNSVLVSNPVFNMGRDLTEKEWVVGLNFDSKYMLYENLALIMETGWAHPSEFQKSVWTRRLANKAEEAWKVAFGLKYTF